ncbi:Ger(x)C family spore germination protein [Bacillus sp. DJP31]|uniref:Ger(x)C family spore germination protein n=1 Tax=Bacillus sp. DJP31 TaxID=3409789 RepID=UPI003BB70A75
MRKARFLFMMILFLLVLTSCVGKREINDLSLVMAVGLDKGSEDGKIKVTVQIARPGDARGQTGAPTGQTGEPIWSVEAEGETIFEAIRNLSSFTSRRIFWAHNFIIVINEELAKEGIAEIIDFFTRNPELRMKTYVVVSPENAGEVVSTITGIEVIPGETLFKLFRYSRLSGFAPKTQMMDLQAAYLNESSQPVLARVKLKKSEISNKEPGKGPTIKQVELAGAGIFIDDKLVGILEPKETKGMLYFREQLESVVLTVPCPSDNEKSLSVEMRNENFDVEPLYKNNTISFQAKITSYARVVDAGCPFSIRNQEEVKQLEHVIENELKTDISQTINKLQKEYKSDVLELGKVFQNQYPYEWKQLSGEWENVFPTVTINISADAHVIHGSLLIEETKSGKKEKLIE